MEETDGILETKPHTRNSMQGSVNGTCWDGKGQKFLGLAELALLPGELRKFHPCI